MTVDIFQRRLTSIEAVDDPDAKRKARGLLDGQIIELRDFDRHVVALEPDSAATDG